VPPAEPRRSDAVRVGFRRKRGLGAGQLRALRVDERHVLDRACPSGSSHTARGLSRPPVLRGATFGGGVGAARDVSALRHCVRDLHALRSGPRVLRRGVLGGGAPSVAAARTPAAPPEPGGSRRSPGSGSRKAAPAARGAGRTAAWSTARGGSPFHRRGRALHSGAARRRVGRPLGGPELGGHRRRAGGHS